MDKEKTTLLKRFNKSLKYWYEYNYIKIPIIFCIIQVIFATAFLDFGIGENFYLESHMRILTNLTYSKENNMAALWLFLAILSTLIMLFNSFSFAKNKSPINLFISNVLILIQIISTIKYLSVFIEEMKIRPTLTFDGAMKMAFITIILSAIFGFISNILTWKYVDFKYVKKEE